MRSINAESMGQRKLIWTASMQKWSCRDSFAVSVGRVAIEMRPKVTETTALGAAYLAGLAIGLFQSTDDLSKHWALDASFEPQMSDDDRERRYAGWLDAVTKVQGGG